MTDSTDSDINPKGVILGLLLGCVIWAVLLWLWVQLRA